MQILLKKILIISLCVITSAVLFGQAFNNAIGSPSIPSAAAMNYGKQAEINTNFYTGAAGYSLPLCSVGDATVSHGVSLNYNSSFRVSEVASNVGLGWHLAAGGLVTRTILGLEDDNPEDYGSEVGRRRGFYHSGNRLDNFDLADAADGEVDSESDIYTFSVGGLTGKFIFDNNKVITMLPQSNIKVNVELSNNRFKGFSIQSPTDGMVYYFGYHPITNVSALEYTDVNDTKQLTSWMLTRIESFDGLHAIDFEYEENIYRFFNLAFCTRTGYRDGSNTNFTDNCSSNNTPPIDTKVEGQIINKIISPTKTITFDYFDRNDLWVDDTNRPKGINKITVQNGGFCYQYNLTQDYFEDQNTQIVTPNYRQLQLKEVQKVSCSGSELIPPYIFEYYGYNNDDGSPFFPQILDKNIDHWGFYNYQYDQINPTDNNGFDNIIPSAFALTELGNPISLNSSVNRESYHNAQLIGALKKVTLPTKGYTEIEYESNTHFKLGSPQPIFNLVTCSCFCGGTNSQQRTIGTNEAVIETGTWQLCIDPFIDNPECTGYDPNNNNSKMIVYNNLGNIHYQIAFNSETFECMGGDISDLNLNVNESYRFVVESLNASATLNLQYTQGTNEVVGGLRVQKTTTHDGISTNNDIIRTYDYNSIEDNTKSSGILFNNPKYAFPLNDYSVLFTSSSVLPLSGYAGYHIGYETATIHQNGNGSIQYEFFIEDTNRIYNQYPIIPDPIRVESGVNKSQKTLNQNGIVEASTETERYNQDGYTDIAGLTFKAQRLPTFNGSSIANTAHAAIYTPRTSVFRTGSVTTTQDSVSNTTDYQYHPTIIAPNIITSTNSDGKPTEVNISYSIDYPTTSIKDVFKDENRIAIPYESVTYVNGSLLDGTRTTFAYFDQNGDNPSESSFDNSIIRTFSTSHFERTWTDGQLQAGAWVVQDTIDSYTNDGLIESWHKAHWDSETYTYNANKLLTAKRYLDFTKSYEYYPNSSLIQKVIAVDKTSSSATYDDLTRAKTVTDDCKDIVSTFDYHFSTGGNDKNYVKTTTTFPITTVNSDLSQLVNLSYKDGLGRDIATVRQNQQLLLG